MANQMDKNVKYLEKRIKALELEVRNNDSRNKKQKAEVDAAISSLVKSIGKRQLETYERLRKELKEKVDVERKEREASHKEYMKNFKLDRDDLRKLLR